LCKNISAIGLIKIGESKFKQNRRNLEELKREEFKIKSRNSAVITKIKIRFQFIKKRGR
jgi:hypothetical protein